MRKDDSFIHSFTHFQIDWYIYIYSYRIGFAIHDRTRQQASFGDVMLQRIGRYDEPIRFQTRRTRLSHLIRIIISSSSSNIIGDSGAMDTNQIHRAAMKCPWLSQKYRGTYPIDLVPTKLAPDSVYIVNLDPSTSKGSHWIGVGNCLSPRFDLCYYFDAFGRDPPTELLPNLFNSADRVIYNDCIIQNVLSDRCGQITLTTMTLLAMGHSLLDVVTKFYVNPEKYLFINELLSSDFIQHLPHLDEGSSSSSSSF